MENLPTFILVVNITRFFKKNMDDFDPKEEKELEEEKDDFGGEPDDDVVIGGKKGKTAPADEASGAEDDSLDDLAEAELGEEDEPYDDVDKW